jgi:hypothetical protein
MVSFTTSVRSELGRLLAWTKNDGRLALFLLSTVVVVWFLGLFVPGRYLPLRRPQHLGERSDALAALFSALAFVGVIVAIQLQMKELAFQRKELRLNRRQLKLQLHELELQRGEQEMNRHELERSAKAQEKSEQALSKQAEALLMAAKLNAANFVAQSQLSMSKLKNSPDGFAPSNYRVISSIEEQLQFVQIYLHEILIPASLDGMKMNNDRPFVGKAYLKNFRNKQLSRLKTEFGADSKSNIIRARPILDEAKNTIALFLTQVEAGDVWSRLLLEGWLQATKEIEMKIGVPRSDEENESFAQKIFAHFNAFPFS